MFEFLLKTSGGIQAVAYTVPGEEADRISRLFAKFESGDADRQCLEIALVNGRIVHPNLILLIAVARLNLIGSAADQASEPVSHSDEGAELQDWQSLSNSSDPPDLALLIDGLEEPLVCQELARDVIELAAAILQEEGGKLIGASQAIEADRAAGSEILVLRGVATGATSASCGTPR